MVARHEMPGKQAKKVRPVGNGVIRRAWPYASSKKMERHVQPDHTVPYGTINPRACGDATMRLRLANTPTLRHSITPLARIRGRARGRARARGPW